MENWFKVSADVFDSKKIKIIRSMRNGDSMALLWFFLLSVARQQNDNGYVYAAEDVPYTAKTLAACGGFKPKLVETALEVFKQYKMIEIEEDGYIYIVGWSEHQNAEALAKLKDRDSEKERNRVANKIRQRRFRFKQAGLNYTGHEKCAYCGDEAVSVDHIIPKSKGGKDEAENVVPCCSVCNSAKLNKDLVDFLNYQLGELGIVELDIDGILANPKLTRFVAYNNVTNSFYSVDNGINNGVINEINDSNNTLPIYKNNSKSKKENNNNNNNNNVSSLVVVGKDNSHLARDDNPAGFWNKNITPITPYIAERIQAVIDEHGETTTMQAVTITAQQGKNSIAYFEGVARNIANGNQKPQKEAMPF